jgi:HD-GYP domain-containing protein (c-di-GMP phosphodiesterase class II)
MSSSLDLLEMIAALKHRLEQANARVGKESALVPAVATGPTIPERIQQLRQQLLNGVAGQQVLQITMHQATTPSGEGAAELPPHLTARSLRLVREARDLLARLRSLDGQGILAADREHPAEAYYQETVHLADLVLRALQTFPEKVGLQTRLATGLDVLLAQINRRTTAIEAVLARDRAAKEQLVELCRLLRELRHGTLSDWNPFFTLAEEIVREAGEGRPLQFVSESSAEPVAFVAGHSLSVARVMARAARTREEWCTRLLQPVVAALVHDVGMLAVPGDLLAQPRPLNAEQSMVVERHCSLGARWASRVQPVHPWLIEAIRNHHERWDGVGYPDGLLAAAVDPLVRLLAVCDVYTALCCRRPHREALNTAAALRDVVSLAERGKLDIQFVRMLQELSPYPVGTAVALRDGASGVVIAVSPGPRAAESPAHPVVLLLTDSAGRPLPCPQVVDLAYCDNRGIAQPVTDAERRQLFGASFPQWA